PAFVAVSAADLSMLPVTMKRVSVEAGTIRPGVPNPVSAEGPKTPRGANPPAPGGGETIKLMATSLASVGALRTKRGNFLLVSLGGASTGSSTPNRGAVKL